MPREDLPVEVTGIDVGGVDAFGDQVTPGTEQVVLRSGLLLVAERVVLRRSQIRQDDDRLRAEDVVALLPRLAGKALEHQAVAAGEAGRGELVDQQRIAGAPDLHAARTEGHQVDDHLTRRIGQVRRQRCLDANQPRHLISRGHAERCDPGHLPERSAVHREHPDLRRRIAVVLDNLPPPRVGSAQPW